MRLYHHPMSSNARRAAMTALVLGTELELVTVDLAKGAHRAPEFLRLNPNGKVPVLDDDGFVLTESFAIMQYLADKTPRQTIYPTDLRARADVNRWLFWCAYHFQPAVSVLGWENMVKPMLGLGAANPAELKRGEGEVTKLADILDAHLAGRAWISGQALTLADIAIATPLMMMRPAKLPIATQTNLLGWLDRMQGLDAWKKTSL